MIPKTISHYNILTKLGEGGMGVVYLAEDTKLDRKVALKFLPSQMTKDKNAVERFKREARAAAALNHPNIVTIHEIGEHEGQTFIAMEHVDGHSFREEIEKGPLGVEKVVNIVKQICEGLDKAHKADIVHRDIKPENILIDHDGRVRILDFGLARMKGVSKLTKESSTLGTVKYMSPEQLRGEEVDHRTDIWSLGVVMYEMLTGDVPFKGEYEQAVVYSILNEDVKALKGLPANMRTQFQKIIDNTLAKNKNQRYQSVSLIIDQFNDLMKNKISENEIEQSSPFKKIFKKSGIIKYIVPIISLLILYGYLSLFQQKHTIKSLAILPFENTNRKEDIEYLCTELPQALISKLSSLKNLDVSSRASAFPLKGKSLAPNEIGKTLNVDGVLLGWLTQKGDDYIISVELSDTKDNKVVWSQNYKRHLSDLQSVEEDLTL
ncbi:hypothetical protein BVY01_03900, partial [bacterium I07]